MDDYMFREHVVGSKVVRENTSYLEILNYSVRIRASFSALAQHTYICFFSGAEKGRKERCDIHCLKIRVDPWKKASFSLFSAHPSLDRYARKEKNMPNPRGSSSPLVPDFVLDETPRS